MTPSAQMRREEKSFSFFPPLLLRLDVVVHWENVLMNEVLIQSELLTGPETWGPSNLLHKQEAQR